MSSKRKSITSGKMIKNPRSVSALALGQIFIYVPKASKTLKFLKEVKKQNCGNVKETQKICYTFLPTPRDFSRYRMYQKHTITTQRNFIAVKVIFTFIITKEKSPECSQSTIKYPT